MIEEKTMVRILDKWVEWDPRRGASADSWPFEATVWADSDGGRPVVRWRIVQFASAKAVAEGKGATLEAAADALLTAARSTFRHALNVFRDAGACGPFVREEGDAEPAPAPDQTEPSAGDLRSREEPGGMVYAERWDGERWVFSVRCPVAFWDARLGGEIGWRFEQYPALEAVRTEPSVGTSQRVHIVVNGGPDTDASQVARGIADALANGHREGGRVV